MYRIKVISFVVVNLAIVTLHFPVSAQTLYMQDDLDIARGMQAMDAGEFEDASKFFQRASERNIGQERLVIVLNNLCAVKYRLGELAVAEKTCTQALRKDRKFWHAYLNRGNARLAQGNLIGAREDYTRAKALGGESDMIENALTLLVKQEQKLQVKI